MERMYMDFFLPVIFVVLNMFVSFEVRVFIHQIIEICDFPAFRSFIVDWKYVHQI